MKTLWIPAMMLSLCATVASAQSVEICEETTCIEDRYVEYKAFLIMCDELGDNPTQFANCAAEAKTLFGTRALDLCFGELPTIPDEEWIEELRALLDDYVDARDSQQP